jgi:two-component system alkaline phosphatase synthesis response regulator PhoP
MEQKRILIADDEKDILELLEYTFQKEGFEVFLASDGEATLKAARSVIPDIILLDIMMPKMDGIEVCRNLRNDARFEDSIIIILTARGEEYSEVAGFEAGADDYVTKPVKLRALLQRIDTLQRRGPKQVAESIVLNGVVIDREKYAVIVSGEEVKLPRKEFELLFLLASNPNKVVTRDRIFEAIWGRDVIVVDRTIDVHIRRLRAKIGDDLIQTVKGVGYKFVAP